MISTIVKSCAAAVLAAGLFGCVNAKKITGPDGREAYSITCNGSARSFGDCMEKAGEICGAKGYDVVDRSGNSTGFVTANQGIMSGAAGYSRNLLVSCKP
ncbi:hypothetical protein [Agrobacterium tumefaciens]|uniref:hypothetical protein n=1 Tax=Agrobacterium tumefaciens TaxID=358 RepID=UPI003BA00743